MQSAIQTDLSPEITILDDYQDFETKVTLIKSENGVYTFRFEVLSQSAKEPNPIKVRWKLPSINVKGIWKSSISRKKRQQYDWELDHLKTRISVDAPVVGVVGHDDSNRHTFACSDAIHALELNALLREEDNHVYCHITFFSERHPAITNFQTDIRIDTREISFSQALKDVSKWWEGYEPLKPMPVPDIAKAPLYSTWYQFHQDLDPKVLVSECSAARELGYDVVIIDDGWQTMDTNRGYDYTGDWEPERIPDMAGFVNSIHDTGMKVGLWFSVPFCGKKSNAYKKFKGKFLTEDHRWAPVFDPRYPEVRDHLINIYTSALKNWKLDGFKLDFIDDFKVYESTELTLANGRDYASVNEGVERLMTDVMNALRKINPNVFIEFRQQYIGPAMRKFGNMFRAFDCPNDSNTNRIRTTDVKLLCGESVVHSDPLTWHYNESVELAAFQFLNAIFSVPQLSIEIATLPIDHRRMIAFYTHFWRENAEVLLCGDFNPQRPINGYPIISTEKNDTYIAGIYDDVNLDLDTSASVIYMINAKHSEKVVIRSIKNYGQAVVIIKDCQGQTVENNSYKLNQGLTELTVPVSGLIQINL